MSDKPKEGAMLMLCLFCGVMNVMLKWVPGRGWSCPSCGTNVKGEEC